MTFSEHLGPFGVSLIQEVKSSLRDAPPIVTAREQTALLLQGANDPFSYVTHELRLVEENLGRAIRSREQALTDISGHLIYGGGKRVRPMVTLLAYLAFGGKRTQDIVDIATAIEQHLVIATPWGGVQSPEPALRID